MRPRRPLRVGVVGLGRAAAQTLPSLLAHPSVRVAGAADPDAAARERFRSEVGAPGYADVEALCARADVDAVYVATPHAAHAAGVYAAVAAGKHVLVEKPMALTLADAEAMSEAARRAGVALVVGPTHGGDPPIVAMRELIRSGTVGRVRSIVNLVYGNFLYRPRRPDELGAAPGAGIVYNQVPHQLEIVRELAGEIRNVRAYLGRDDPRRPTDASLNALLRCDGGAVASLVYRGYDRFDTDEFSGWSGEFGETKEPAHGAARRALRAFGEPGAEAAAKARSGFAGRGMMRAPAGPRAHPHFGMLLVSCEGADLRPSPRGVLVYDDEGVREIDVPLGEAFPDKRAAIDELVAAACDGVAPRHDGAWGMATVAAMLAVARSAAEDREVLLETPVEVDAC